MVKAHDTATADEDGGMDSCPEISVFTSHREDMGLQNQMASMSDLGGSAHGQNSPKLS